MAAKMLTTTQVGVMLGIHRSTVRKLIEDGALEAYRPRWEWRIPEEVAIEFKRQELLAFEERYEASEEAI